MNKGSLLDPWLKSLVHLSEEEQTNTIDSVVNEVITTESPPTSEVVAVDNLERPSSSVESNKSSG